MAVKLTFLHFPEGHIQNCLHLDGLGWWNVYYRKLVSFSGALAAKSAQWVTASAERSQVVLVPWQAMGLVITQTESTEGAPGTDDMASPSLSLSLSRPRLCRRIVARTYLMEFRATELRAFQAVFTAGDLYSSDRKEPVGWGRVRGCCWQWAGSLLGLASR